MQKTYCVKIDKNLEEHQFNSLIKFLSKDKYERVKKFIKIEDTQRTLIADILIRQMVSEITGKKLEQIVIKENSYGKPYIKDEININFNISHSGEWVVAVINNLPVGIDIEKIAPIDYKIAKKIFTIEEYEYIMNKNVSSRIDYFYEIWTLKESYVKAVGRGLSIPLNSFSVYINDNDIKIETRSGFNNYFFKQYNIDPAYKMAVCSTREVLQEEVKIFGLNQFYNQLDKK